MDSDGDYDLAGFAVGAVSRPGAGWTEHRRGDIVIACPPAASISNGYSLVRKLSSSLGWPGMPGPFEPAKTLARRC